MIYLESVKYLKTIEEKGYHPSHQNSLNLMRVLGEPQENLPVIHITGTNGKGSTLTFLRDILTTANYKVASFMSPHIFEYKETIQNQYGIISDDDFANATNQVEIACNKLVKSNLPHPTIFECLVAIAMIHFHAHDYDFVLVEVGLGGREDATNIFSHPLLTIITSISLDHETWLGHSLVEIASHKAGIIRNSAPVILSPNVSDVVQVISEEVKKVDSTLYLLDEELISYNLLFQSLKCRIFNLHTPFFNYTNLEISMLGTHQIINLSTSLLAIEELKKTYNIPLAAIEVGIKDTKLSCRDDLISVNPLILIDGGHNPAGLSSLKDLIQFSFSDYKVITVLGILRDKAYDSILSTVSSFSDELIMTQPESPRALLLSSVSSTTAIPFTPIKDYKKALLEGLNRTSHSTILVVTGSLYLTCPAKKWLKNHLSIQ